MDIPEVTYIYHCTNRKCRQFKKDIRSSEGPLTLAVTTGKFPLVCNDCELPLSLADTIVPKRQSRNKPSAADMRAAIGEADAEIDEFLSNLSDQATRRKLTGEEPA